MGREMKAFLVTVYSFAMVAYGKDEKLVSSRYLDQDCFGLPIQG